MNCYRSVLYEKIIDFFEQENFCSSKEFSYEKWKKCSAFGLFAMSLLRTEGGLSESYLESLYCHYAMGYSCDDNGLSFVINNHLIVLAGILNKFCSDSQKEKYFSRLINGEIIASFAITDSNHGSDSFNTNTYVKKQGDNYILNGSKLYISNCPIADLYVVIAKNPEKSSLSSLSAFFVEKEDEGVFLGPQISKMGLDGCPMGEIVLKDCVVRPERLISTEGNGICVANSALEWERCFEFATNLGRTKKIIETCIEYVNSRKQFSKNIGSYQAISNKIVDMYIAHEQAKLMMENIARLKNSNKNTFFESSIFKCFVGEMYAAAALNSLQMHGAYGYSTESGIEKEVRDALAAKIYSGTTEIQKNIIADGIGICRR